MTTMSRSWLALSAGRCLRGASRAGALALLAVAVLAPAASAADWCLGGVVFESFSAPGRGKCKPVYGHLNAQVVSGVACQSSDGDALRLGFVIYPRSGLTSEIIQADLPYPSLQQGVASIRHIFSNGTTGAATAAGLSFQRCLANEDIP